MKNLKDNPFCLFLAGILTVPCLAVTLAIIEIFIFPESDIVLLGLELFGILFILWLIGHTVRNWK